MPSSQQPPCAAVLYCCCPVLQGPMRSGRRVRSWFSRTWCWARCGACAAWRITLFTRLHAAACVIALPRCWPALIHALMCALPLCWLWEGLLLGLVLLWAEGSIWREWRWFEGSVWSKWRWVLGRPRALPTSVIGWMAHPGDVTGPPLRTAHVLYPYRRGRAVRCTRGCTRGRRWRLRWYR